MPLALFISLCAIVTNSAIAADLQWRRGKAPADASATTTTAATNANFRRDAAVRHASWDELPAGGGPTLSSGATGQATMRSVVVNRDESNSSLRAAQLEQPAGETNFGAGVGQTPTDRDRFLEEMSRSFSTQPETQPGGFLPTETRPQDTGPVQFPVEPRTTQPFDSGLPAPGGGFSQETVQTEQQRSADVCAEELANLRTNTLEQVALNIRIVGTPGIDYPYECSIDEGVWHGGRCWPETVFMWKASALCHKPLYFEDEQMERYGHSWGPCCDTIASGVHFFGTLPVLPYCMGVTPPCECVYALGHYRPGSCAPRYIEPIPISFRGALFQAGATVGAAAILP